MLNSFVTEVDADGLESSTLGINFLVLPDHFRDIKKNISNIRKLKKGGQRGGEVVKEFN